MRNAPHEGPGIPIQCFGGCSTCSEPSPTYKLPPGSRSIHDLPTHHRSGSRLLLHSCTCTTSFAFNIVICWAFGWVFDSHGYGYGCGCAGMDSCCCFSCPGVCCTPKSRNLNPTIGSRVKVSHIAMAIYCVIGERHRSHLLVAFRDVIGPHCWGKCNRHRECGVSGFLAVLLSFLIYRLRVVINHLVLPVIAFSHLHPQVYLNPPHPPPPRKNDPCINGCCWRPNLFDRGGGEMKR